MESGKVETEQLEKKKRVRLSKGARKAAEVYDRYSKKTVKQLRTDCKEQGVTIPLSRLSKSMLIAILEEQTREPKPKRVKKESVLGESKPKNSLLEPIFPVAGQQ